MQLLTNANLNLISGGMKWEGNRMSDNVELRGWTACWNPNTPGGMSGFLRDTAYYPSASSQGYIRDRLQDLGWSAISAHPPTLKEMMEFSDRLGG